MLKGSRHTEETKAKLRAAAMRKGAGVIVHGTTDGYNNHRCRCEHCSAAWSAYMKFRRKAERIRESASTARRCT